jgi:aspartyl-tRNA(Asn)/glutamyl-tRNA(Gln) amidotransferase subunit C
VNREDVLKVAALARLEIPEERVEQVAAELSAVLDFVAALDRLDLAGCEPSVFAPGTAELRADAVDETRRLTTEQALAGAPEAEDGFFLVPPVVENLNL